MWYHSIRPYSNHHWPHRWWVEHPRCSPQKGHPETAKTKFSGALAVSFIECIFFCGLLSAWQTWPYCKSYADTVNKPKGECKNLLNITPVHFFSELAMSVVGRCWSFLEQLVQECWRWFKFHHVYIPRNANNYTHFTLPSPFFRCVIRCSHTITKKNNMRSFPPVGFLS